MTPAFMAFAESKGWPTWLKADRETFIDQRVQFAWEAWRELNSENVGEPTAEQAVYLAGEAGFTWLQSEMMPAMQKLIARAAELGYIQGMYEARGDAYMTPHPRRLTGWTVAGVRRLAGTVARLHTHGAADKSATIAANVLYGIADEMEARASQKL